MQFLQPALLWGALAIVLPIALHFWHQKKGKEIAWAATRFLFEKNQQSRRGLRLDQLLLLALRCLMLLTLAFLLSEPVFKNKNTAEILQKIHLVQPDAFVVSNYRFELERARENGEAIYWLTPDLRPADETSQLPAAGSNFTPVLLQNSINRAAREGAELHLYLKNKRPAYPLPFIQTPADFQLHASADTLSKGLHNYRLVGNNQKLYVNTNNRLATAAEDPTVAFAAQPVGQGTFKVHLDLKNPLERKTAEAALRAFGEVYGLEVAMDENTAGSPDLVIGENAPVAPNPTTLYIVALQAGLSAYPNVVYSPESLTPQTSPLVADGQLPEWLGQRILEHWEIKGDPVPWRRGELSTLFQPTAQPTGNPAAPTQRIIFIILLVLVILERIIALTRNA